MIRNESRKQNTNYINVNRNTHENKKFKELQSMMIVQGIQKYRKSMRPLLTNDDVVRLQNKLALEQLANQRYKQRDTTNDYYLDYNVNPFQPLKPYEKKQLLKRIQQQKKKVVEIVQHLRPPNKFSPKIKKQMSQNFQKLQFIKKKFTMQSQKTLNDIKKGEFIRQSEKNKEEDTKNKIKTQNNQQLLYFLQDESIDKLQIGQIAAIKQKNFFKTKQNKINIFKVLKDDRVLNAFDHLVQHKFCWNSVIDKDYKIKIPIYRDLSNLARKITTFNYIGKQRIIDHIYPSQLTFSIKQINFSDVINIATHRISPQFLYAKIYDEGRYIQDGSEEQSEEDNRIIIYRRNNTHHLQNFIGIDQQQQEILQYKKRPFTGLQQLQKQKYQRYKKQIQQQVKKGVKLCLLNVFDDQLHKTIDMRSSSSIRGILKNKKKVQKSDSYEKTVRMKKMHCDKTQIIRLKQFKQILNSKNSFINIKSNISKGKFSQTLKLSQTMRR